MSPNATWAVSSGRIPFFRRPFHEYSLRERVVLSQMPLSVTAGLTAVLVLVFFPGTLANPLFVSFLAMQGVILALCYALPWERLPCASFLLIPWLDFVAITLGREGGQDSLTGISLLAVFPVIWLCASGLYPRTALLTSFFAPLGIIWVPLIVKGGAITGQDLARSMLLPVMILGIGVSVSLMTLSMVRQQRHLEAKDAQLRHALKDSKRQEDLLNSVLETVHLGVLAVDASGNDILMNRKQRENHRLASPADNSDPDESRLLVFQADRTTPVPAESRPVRRAVMGENFTDNLVWLGTGSGQRAITTSARAMKDHDGVYAGSVIVFSDVTDLVNALAAKDDFVANVSHEFRTPLTSILGYVELLLDDHELPVSHQGPLKIIRRNAERLLTLVSDLLASRNGQLIVSPQAVNVAELVRASVSAALPRAHTANVQLRAEAPDRLDAHVDSARISQVLDNLVSNAIKYSPDGGDVAVSLTSEGSNVVCRVSDTGMGMTEKDQTEVFTKFFRTDNVRNTSIPGVGLGLSISKAIIEAHGGSIGLQSAVGRGTTFTVRVPV